MTKFTDNLWRDLVREHGAQLMRPERAGPARSVALRRPRVLAGSTLVLAGVGVALTVGLTASGSTPAYAVTHSNNGTVTMRLNDIKQFYNLANPELNAIGVHSLSIMMASGPALVAGAVTCMSGTGVSGLVKIILTDSGTEVIRPGTTSGNTGVGTWHLAACWVFSSTGGSGNTGSAFSAYTPASAAPLPVISNGAVVKVGREPDKGAHKVAFAHN